MKYIVLLDDKPTESFEGVLQVIRYSKREEYLTMEYRDVPKLSGLDIHEKIKVHFEEIAVNNEEIRKLRDFLNSLDLGSDKK